MSVVSAKTLPYGPAKIDIQIEQGADFILPLQILFNTAPLDISAYTIAAWFSPQWAPEQQQIALTIDNVDLSTGKINVRFPAANSLSLALPTPPRKTYLPQVFELGGWVLHLTASGSPGQQVRYCEGQVFLDRSPWLT